MTVTVSTSEASYAGNDVTVAFTVPFRFLDASHLAVMRKAADGSSTTLTLNTDYTVAGVGNPTGTVTTTVAPATGTTLLILRDVPATQEKDYVEGDRFPAASHEDALDKLTMLYQQGDERNRRALTVPPGETISDLPAIDDLREKFLYFTQARAPVGASAPSVVVTDGMADFNSSIAATGATIPADQQYFRTAGFYAPGDGGGGLYTVEPSEPSHAGKIALADGKWGELVGDQVCARSFGAVGNGSADDTTAVSSWISFCELKGATGVLTAGVFIVGSISLTVTANVRLSGRPGATIKGTADGIGSIITLDGSVSRPAFSLTGVIIDNSLRTFVSAEASGTGLSIKNFDHYQIQNCQFLAGADYRAAKGDSGTSINQCGWGLISGCYFRGQPDKGIYLTGGPSAGTADDYGDCVVQGNVFDRCNTAASNTRQGRRVVFNGNIVLQCLLGFRHTEAGAGAAQVDPGRENITTSNFFWKCGSRCVSLRWGIGDVVANNVIKDHGYDLDGALPAGGTNAIHLQGTQKAIVTGNVICRDETVADATHVGILVQSLTLVSGARNSIGNLIDGNSISGCPTGIQESTGSSGNHGCNMYATDVTTPFLPAAGSTSMYTARGDDGTHAAFATIFSTVKRTAVVSGIGAFLAATGAIGAHTDSATPVSVARDSDGNLVTFYLDTVAQGGIAMSAGTVSYNPFLGTHWTQLGNSHRVEIPFGTVMDTIGTMCSWPGEPVETRLPKVKVSNVPASRSVYGTFQYWDEEREAGDPWDMYVMGVGAGFVRIGSGVSVAIGDLVESAGDGTARPQADDTIRSSTVGKVTSLARAAEHSDGSYVVPCVLMCG